MTDKVTYETPFRRRREGKTDYAKRLAALKGQQPRLVVRRRSRNYSVQVITYYREGDRTVASAFTPELAQYGWKAGCGNAAAAYLAGFLCGKKALKGKVTQAVADIGMATPVQKSAPYAAVKGAIDAGLLVPASPKVFPPMDKMDGTRIAAYAKQAGERQFSGYRKKGFDPAQAKEAFTRTKEAIAKAFEKDR